jgi:hypothetical protein
MSAATAPVTHAPPLLWAAARVLIETMFALFGDPARIAAQHTHRQSERALLLKWLRAGEAFMRHLLLIEAAHYAKPNTRPLLRETVKCVRRPLAFEPDKPEAWRVSFRCFVSPTLRQAQRDAVGDAECGAAGSVSVSLSLSKAKRPGRLSREERWCADYWPKPKFYSAWPLAERAEALLRAFNNPEPYARRLSRRLHATPHRAAALTRQPSALIHMIPESDFVQLRDHAGAARKRIDSG